MPNPRNRIIFSLYRPMDSNKEFIAKKVREDSDELEMLRLLNSFPLKSDHVISLIDSLHGWAILPEMLTVKGYVEFARDLSESGVSQICLGLIKGVAYLHGHLIAIAMRVETKKSTTSAGRRIGWRPRSRRS